MIVDILELTMIKKMQSIIILLTMLIYFILKNVRVKLDLIIDQKIHLLLKWLIIDCQGKKLFEDLVHKIIQF